MKKLLLTLALAAVANFADAQGTIQIAINAGTRFFVNGAQPLNTSAGGPAAGTFNFGVFAGTAADSLSSEPLGEIAKNTAVGGVITATSPQAHQIPGFLPNTTAFIQIRAWESRFGSDWRAAQQGGLYGQTEVRSFLLGQASGPGTVIWNADNAAAQFTRINLVPEPSTIALAVLGLGSLLLFRRRK